MARLLAAVELGGTKALAAVATDPLSPLRRTRIKTQDPACTLEQIADFFDEVKSDLGTPEALGIAPFGPIEAAASKQDPALEAKGLPQLIAADTKVVRSLGTRGSRLRYRAAADLRGARATFSRATFVACPRSIAT